MITLLAALALAAPAPELGVDWSDARVAAETQVRVLGTLLEQGQAEKALEIIGQIRADGGDDPRLDVLQGRALHATGMTTEALSLLGKYTRSHRGDAEGWAALGVVQADSGALADAGRSLERARRLAPDDADILNNLGFVRLSEGRAEDAVEILQASLRLDPSQVRTRNNLGFALARLERDEAALQAFRAAGSEADARYNLGVACLERGDRAGAVNQFNLALEAQPGHPAATSAIAQINKEASP